MPSYKDLGIPSGTTTVDVRVFDIGAPGETVVASAFMTPIVPGYEAYSGPMYAFLIEHKPSGRRIMFDLGPRKDSENYAPAVLGFFEKIGRVLVEKDVIEQLAEGGIQPEDVDTVIWSHTHFDHTGDMAKFPSTTELAIGKGTIQDTYPTKPDGTLLESDFSGRKVTEISFDKSHLTFGGLRAVDFLGDGSLYLLDVPGHMAGHIGALARVTPTTFLLLGGDACHHVGQLRPTEQLHRHQPCPGELLAQVRRSVSAEYFTPHHEDGTFDLVHREKPMLDVPENILYHDPKTARESLAKLGAFDANDDVFVLIAHDASVGEVVEKFPVKLNDWKEKGWKEKGLWAFMDVNNVAYRFGNK
ncbi:hypothetical protein H0H92_010373 [Tricholoma furcatifolium]|nr:hypothetical protein H0H92_010373 [Tricholoma furcatifolium]